MYLPSKGEVKTLGHWTLLPSLECWEVQEKAIWHIAGLYLWRFFYVARHQLDAVILDIDFILILVTGYHSWRTEAPLLHSVYSCCPCRYVIIQDAARLLLVFRSVFMKPLPVTEAKLFMEKWINWRYKILFLSRKINFEWESEFYQKILAPYLHNTLTAVAFVHVADYEVNLIFIVFLIMCKVRNFKWKKEEKTNPWTHDTEPSVYVTVQ